MMAEPKKSCLDGYYDQSRLIPSSRWDLFFLHSPGRWCVFSMWHRLNIENVQKASLFDLLLRNSRVCTWFITRVYTYIYHQHANTFCHIIHKNYTHL